jgi:hypothetical protein
MARVGVGALVADAGAADHLQRHDRLEADPEVLLLRDPVGVLGHEPERALGAGIAARERRSVLGRAARSHQDAASGLEWQVERRLQPIEPGLDVGLPGRGEIRPTQLVQPTHPRPRAGVQRQDVRADLGKDAVGGSLVRHVGGDRGHAQPGADGLERLGVAGDDRHPGAVRYQGLDQSQAKATASAGDDEILIFEAHQF